MIAHGYLVAIKTASFIAEHEKRVATERLLLNRSRLWQDFDAADRDTLVIAIFANTSHRWEKSHVHFISSALRAESGDFIFLSGWFDKENLA